MQVQNQCRKLQGNQDKNWEILLGNFIGIVLDWRVQSFNQIQLGILPQDLGCKGVEGRGKKITSITQPPSLKGTSNKTAWKR